MNIDKFIFFVDDEAEQAPGTVPVLESVNQGDIVSVGKKRWQILRSLGSFQAYAYKHPSKHKKLYMIQAGSRDEPNEVVVFEVGGSGQRVGKDIATGTVSLTTKPNQVGGKVSKPKKDYALEADIAEVNRRRRARGQRPIALDQGWTPYEIESMLDKMRYDARRSPNPVRGVDADEFCEIVARAYEAAPDFEPDEAWRWERLAEHVRKMFRRISSRYEVDFVPGQPYETAEEMVEEVMRTGRIEISTDYNVHPTFDEKTNLQFRAVHDVLAHILPAEAGDFSSKGELQAYNLHRSMAPPDTWPALFTEVVGQACYAGARGRFPTQKIAVLPGFDYYEVGSYTGSPRKHRHKTAANPKRRLMS